MRRLTAIAAALSMFAGAACAATRDLAPLVLPPPAAPGKAVQPFVQVNTPVIALMHVRVIDGTGPYTPAPWVDKPDMNANDAVADNSVRTEGIGLKLLSQIHHD